jgi:hypothetical protein
MKWNLSLQCVGIFRKSKTRTGDRIRNGVRAPELTFKSETIDHDDLNTTTSQTTDSMRKLTDPQPTYQVPSNIPDVEEDRPVGEAIVGSAPAKYHIND